MEPLVSNFSSFLNAIELHEPNKLNTLINHIDPSIYEYIAECDEYEVAIEILRNMYVKPKNEIFARHLLSSRRQQSSESLDEYLQALKLLSKDCNYKSVTSAIYCEESVRDAFISGLQSQNIRLRLLENKSLDLQTAFDQARALDLAQKSSESYTPYTPLNAINCNNTEATDQNVVASIRHKFKDQNQKCYFCGNDRHPRQHCPARDISCKNATKLDTSPKYARVRKRHPLLYM